MITITDTDLTSIIPESQKVDAENGTTCFKGAGANKQVFNWTIEEFLYN